MNLIRKLAERQAPLDSRALPKAHTKREKSLTEREAEYHEVGYGLHFCCHDKTYYEPCNACRRTRSEARANLLNL